MLDYDKGCFRKICKGIKINKNFRLYFGSGGHGDHLTRLFGGQNGFYDGQWPLTGRYFKRWQCILMYKTHSCLNSYPANLSNLSRTNVPFPITIKHSHLFRHNNMLFFNTFKGNVLYNIEPNLLIFHANGLFSIWQETMSKRCRWMELW